MIARRLLGPAAKRAYSTTAGTTAGKSFRDYARSPATKIMLMLTAISSELAYLVKKQSEGNMAEQRATTQLDLMKLLKERVLAGEKVDVERELNLASDDIDVTVESVLEQLAAADEQWVQGRKKVENREPESAPQPLIQTSQPMARPEQRSQAPAREPLPTTKFL